MQPLKYEKMKRLFTLLLVAIAMHAMAQVTPAERTITTAVPFLTISSDARASGLGDQGVATPVDAFINQWNPAKAAFAERQMSVGISYTPYLESLVNDVSLLSAGYSNKINDRSAFSVGLRYFGLGTIEFRQTIDQQATEVKPNEFALEGSYALKLSENFSMAVGGRFISSNLRFQQAGADSQAGNAFAVDVAGYYQSQEIAYSSFSGIWRAGFNVSNLGGKLSYGEASQENFLPTNLKFGGGFDFIFDADNKLGVYTEFNKLLVPTPQDFDGDGDIDSEDRDEYNNISFFNGIFQSFTDAPDGLSEEFQEFTVSIGTEYTYQDAFKLRAGYFNEAAEKGSRKFFTLGAGFEFKTAQIDLSYLFSTSAVRNPLENTLRFSVSFNLGREYEN